jgi:hypothetical protein
MPSTVASKAAVKAMAILSQRTAKSLRKVKPEVNYARAWNN